MIESGQQFGLYVIKDVFDAGESKACCCAEDPFFNREVLLKILRVNQQVEQDQLDALFERLALLDHPSIAPIYDSGLEEGFFYYTSAYYPGISLAQQMVSPMLGEEALKVVFELAEGLDYAFQLDAGQRQLKAENIFFDADGRAVMSDYGAAILSDQLVLDSGADSLESALYSLGELLLRMLLGPDYAAGEPVESSCAKLGNSKIRRLVGRFLLPGERRFSSFAELLEELSCFDEAGELSSTGGRDENIVVDVRRLVAEKNSLQQALDSARFSTSQAEEKVAEGLRQLEIVRQEAVTAKEEAHVAWELVAGQKHDRWRPAAWAFGGFLIGFILSGSYGYYYSEQTRGELLAKLKDNEQLIRSAAWRPAEEKQARQLKAEQVLVQTGGSETRPIVVENKQIVLPVAEESRNWWPAGSEFSSAAAIPVEKLKAALKVTNPSAETLSGRLKQDVESTVRRWAEAWSRQDLAGYFSAYSQEYRPEFGRSRQEWREMRRNRVAGPEWIELEIDDIRVHQVDTERVQVKLKQSYRSNYYQDQVFKSINLIKENGEWRILTERSLGFVTPPADIVGG